MKIIQIVFCFLLLATITNYYAQKLGKGFGNHSIVVDDNGKVYTWGDNFAGQLGNGNNPTDSDIPIDISSSGALSGKTIIAVTSGVGFSLALGDDGKVYSWGDNFYGQLGNGNSPTDSNIPIDISSSGALNGKTITAIAAGNSFSFALGNDGKVYSWGENNYGQLGNGVTGVNSDIPIDISSSGALSGKQISAIDASLICGIALGNDGKVYTWGYNGQGQLGNNTVGVNSNVPIDISGFGAFSGKTISAISGGYYFFIALDNSGKVYSWGDGEYGKLGNNNAPSDSYIPIDISSFGAFSGKTITSISTGGRHALATDGSGKTYSWGYNNTGQLGNNATFTNSIIPIDISGFGLLSGKTITAVACPGVSNSLALDSDGIVYSWGYNNNGELGNNNSPTASAIPVQVSNIDIKADPILPAQKISKGYGLHSIANYNNNNVYGWGSNFLGQVGSNFGGNKSTPTIISESGALSGKTITQLVTGYYHSIALDNNGKVYTWGYNNKGQLGDNNQPDNSGIPVDISSVGALSGKTITQISAGYYHSMALDNTGKVYTWGWNHYGELGNNTTTDSYIPIDISNSGALSGKTIVAIASGFYHGIALDNNGKVYTWGWNDYGQLGNNDLGNNSHIPIDISTFGALSGKTISIIAGGGEHSMALGNDGKVYTWGYDNQGQLGNNASGLSQIPADISSIGALSGQIISDIAAGYENSIALGNDGKVYTWGDNSYNQLGNNSNVDSQIPIDISSYGAISGKTISAIGTGYKHVVVMDSDGTLYSWGENNAGQLGNGNMPTDSKIPTELSTIALPVELTSFNVKKLKNGVNLLWQTATEINNYGFEIQRQNSEVSSQNSRENKNNWETIAFINGHGNSNSPKIYTFTDSNPPPSTLKYRLKQIDFDGAYEYSETLTIENDKIADYKLDQNYPNPFNPVTNIKFSMPEKSIVKLEIYSITGERVASLLNEERLAGNYNISWDASNFSSGIYFYRLITQNRILTNKMILLK